MEQMTLVMTLRASEILHFLYGDGFICEAGYGVFGEHVGCFEGFLGVTRRGSGPRVILCPFQVMLRPSFGLCD